MATFGWSYKSNVCGAKRPKEQIRKVEEWQKDRPLPKTPLHKQSHSTESIYAGMKKRKYNPRAKVFVGNLNKETKEVTLAEYFSFFGEIASLKIIKDHETRVSRGFAFITFTEPESADKARRWCKYHYPRLDGRQITISTAERRRLHKVEPSPRSASYRERKSGHTLYWEYKWSQDADVEVFGPYETSLMLEWRNAGYFNNGCWVRQTDPHVEQDSKDAEEEQESKRQKLVVSYSCSSSSEDDEAQHHEASTESDENVKEACRNADSLQSNANAGEGISEAGLACNNDSTSVTEDTMTHETLSEMQSTSSGDKSSELTKTMSISCQGDSAAALKVEDNLQYGSFDFRCRSQGYSDGDVESKTNSDRYSELRLSERSTDEGLTQTATGEDGVTSNEKSDKIPCQKNQSFYYSDTAEKLTLRLQSETSKVEHYAGHPNEQADDSSAAWCEGGMGNYRRRDALGRDSSSSSEDEDMFYGEENTPTTENEFVHVSEIDFSMFP